VFKAIRSQEVLTLHRDYFRLSKTAGTSCLRIGAQTLRSPKSWQISVEMLLKKSGSQSPLEKFRHMLKHIAKHDHLPDYRVVYNEDTDIVTFHNRESWWENIPCPRMARRCRPCPPRLTRKAEPQHRL